MAGTKRATSFRLSREAISAIEGLSERLGLSQASVVEMAVRLVAEEKLPPAPCKAARGAEAGGESQAERDRA